MIAEMMTVRKAANDKMPKIVAGSGEVVMVLLPRRIVIRMIAVATAVRRRLRQMARRRWLR